MIKDNTVYLRQILDAIEILRSYVRGVTYEEFLKDKMRQDAMVREIEIIGEAAKRISDEYAEKHIDVPLIEATRMRNKLIHEYDDIDFKIVWDTANESVVELEKGIKKILGM